MYVKLNGDTPIYPYTLDTLRAENPETAFSVAPSAASLADFGVYPVEEVTQPAIDPGEVIEGGVEKVGGVWKQKWTVRAMTPEEMKALVPQVISMRQARLALLAADQLTAADAAVAAAGGAAQIEWEYAAEVRRDHPLIAGIGGALGLTEEEIDELFKAAGAL
jgi:hypothetical protein